MNFKKIVLLGFVCFAGYHGVLKTEETSSAETSSDDVFVKIRREFSDKDIMQSADKIQKERDQENLKVLVRDVNGADIVKIALRLRNYSSFYDQHVMLDLFPLLPLGYAITQVGLAKSDEGSKNFKTTTNHNFLKHQAWYTNGCSNISSTQLGYLAETGSFAVADFAIHYANNALNKLESVQTKTDQLSDKSRHFIFRNGKMVTAAAFGRAARIVVGEGKNGLNSTNAQQFGQDVFRHLSAEFTNEYIAPTIVNMIPVDKNSWQKDVAHGIVNIGAFFLIDFLCKK